MSEFQQIGIANSEILTWLTSRNMKTPTEVQKACIPAIIQKRDVLACATTGSGKTAAYLIPVFQELIYQIQEFFCLILSPTRELANQIWVQACEFSQIKSVLITGGMDIVEQNRQLAIGPNIVIATPGRLADLIRAAKSSEDKDWDLSVCKILILDEADRLIEDNFDKDLAEIFEALNANKHARTQTNTSNNTSTTTGKRKRRTRTSRRRTLLFSATYSAAVRLELETMIKAAALNDDDVAAEEAPPLIWSSNQIQSSQSITSQNDKRKEEEEDREKDNTQSCSPPISGVGLGTTVSQLKQCYIFSKMHHNEAILLFVLDRFMRENPHSSVILFTNKCKWCEVLARVLRQFNFPLAVLHSAAKEKQREAALRAFKSSHVRLLVATDLAARGLDIPCVDLVINHNVPVRSAAYVHRVGRTARSGRVGTAITFVDKFSRAAMLNIEKFINKKLEKYDELDAADMKEISTMVTDVAMARRNAERALDEGFFYEKNDINKAKRMRKG